MIVVDASVAVEVLLNSKVGQEALIHIERESELHVPEHFHIEVLSVLRRYSLSHELQEPRSSQLLQILSDLRTIRYPNLMLYPAIWELRSSLTAYDAAYLALARQLDAHLITQDKALASRARSEGRLIDLEENVNKSTVSKRSFRYLKSVD